MAPHFFGHHDSPSNMEEYPHGACTCLVPLGQATGTSTTSPSGTGRLGQVVLVPVGQEQLVTTIDPFKSIFSFGEKSQSI